MRILFYQDRQTDLLRHVCTSKPAGGLLLGALGRTAPLKSFGQVLHLLPDSWSTRQYDSVIRYASEQWMIPDLYRKSDSANGCLLINARSIYRVDEDKIKNLFRSMTSDVICLQVTESLTAGSEAIRLTPDDHIVGFRRFYESEMQPSFIPSDWPDIVFLKEAVWKKFCDIGKVPLQFPSFLEKVKSFSFSTVSMQVGGRVLNLRKEYPMVAFLEEAMSGHAEISQDELTDVRVIGPVRIGQHVKIGAGTLLLGPVVISDHVTIGSNATIRRSLITEHCLIDDEQVVNQRIILAGKESDQAVTQEPLCSANTFFEKPSQPDFKGWSFFSYARLGKRLFDILFATCILIILMPIFLVVGILVKLTSPGPVFYKARRQGRHGKEFGCLKFRTMVVQADAMQERLRVVNQVDGPQFKIEHDPRISGLGKFLRDTCIDELPQFLNVLFGQMSVVGPRPSPTNENESSPAWRDARLSVRPGITGLWQISRTRQASMDFQEWVHYDTKYVKKLSFRHDLYICYKTARMLFTTFLDQFG